MSTNNELMQVFAHNNHDALIGEQRGGFDPEVAADLGYETPDSMRSRLAANAVSRAVNLELPYENRPPTTIAQQRRNAKKHIDDHLARTNKQVTDPRYFD